MNVYKERLLSDEELTWLKQFRKLLAPYLEPGISILDLGCATGYAYKSFRPFRIKYIGLDFDAKRLETAREYFQGDSNANFILHDLRDPLPIRSADIVISDATLAHLPKLQPILQRMADAADKVLIFRTLLGEEEILMPDPAPGLEGWSLNQYAFSDVLPFLESCSFRTQVYRCEHTDSMPVCLRGQIRRHFVVLGVRKSRHLK